MATGPVPKIEHHGWVAMNQALHTPGRVVSITLLDPAGLTRPDAQFYRWLGPGHFDPDAAVPSPRREAGPPAHAGGGADDAHVGRHPQHQIEPKKPGMLTDDELRAITVPILLVTGARSALITP